jgi:hypothetical protein
MSFLHQRSGRVRAALLVLALHSIVLYVTVSSTWSILTRPQKETATIVFLPRLLPDPPPALPARSIIADVALPVLQRPGETTPMTLLSLGVAPNWMAPQSGRGVIALTNLGRSLPCNIINYDRLSEAEKQRCLKSFSNVPPSQPYALTAREVERNARFTFALATRQAPLLLPCFNGGGVGVSIWTLYCFGDAIVNGFDTERPMFVTYADMELERAARKPEPFRTEQPVFLTAQPFPGGDNLMHR